MVSTADSHAIGTTSIGLTTWYSESKDGELTSLTMDEYTQLKRLEPLSQTN